MEAIGGFIADLDSGPTTVAGVYAALSLMREAGPEEARDASLLDLQTAADLADAAEELSRLTAYWQLVASAAVDRSRKRAAQDAHAVPGWTTGWQASAKPTRPEIAEAAGTAVPARRSATEDIAVTLSAASDDGYRNTAEFLRARLHISLAEARSRLRLAEAVLPRQDLTGELLPPVREELGAAVAAGDISARSAGVTLAALEKAKPVCDTETLGRMEHALTRTAVEHDPDFLVRIAQRWLNAVDPDGSEPSEELLRQLQGAFIRRRRHGLQHLEIFATDEQFEHLITVMNTATNPRIGYDDGGSVDFRTVAQKRLDGLVGGCEVALGSGGLPAAGGLRPQVMVTIDYRDLLERIESSQGTGTMLFSGPVTASTVRKIACDADIIPVVLGGEGRVLDIGRASRVFPPHIRKALVARDQGCAFPGCSIPAPWCEAHHIDYWSRGGATSTDNGVLLCSHHHHVVHKEQWEIQVRLGVPWFIPPPHVDPGRRPCRNGFFRPVAA
ncbi:DUF222 domain-containing protein [Arthrobacter sp. YD4]|uniref:HNH endonuclease n=1 Tax=Arthrobacter sp. YD4 TaxID=3058043 RepID=UPI0025B39274|nr:HNH endonuclease signature motif containing protein [Arthrobacter sp. YD4]MDN3937046.1 DUF222 domain-containing protein [Arthrobacter sp. YD4]